MKNKTSFLPSDELSELLFYTTPNGSVKIEIYIQNETVWLSQQKLALLFGIERSVITKHLKNIYASNELIKESTCAKIAQVQTEGNREVTREIEFYNLDAIISVGYRVNSSQATQFRIWATERLKEYIIKGFTMDDDRLKNGQYFGKDYFKELLERIRSIRTSERRIYQQITDIFAECSIDYNANDETTKHFYASVQNKFHYAITGDTAAEIIFKKVDSNKPYMGLSTWKNAPEGRILKSDTSIAKNYLSEIEIKKLERTVSGYFDYLENLVENRISFTMADLANSVNKFLSFNEYKVLEGLGKISKKEAEEKAFTEYDKFNKTQNILSDFDKDILRQLKAKE
jgi:hypothetical protein